MPSRRCQGPPGRIPARPYFDLVFTLPRPIADTAYPTGAVLYGLLLKVAAETLITIAADPKHLGARIAATKIGRLF